MNYHEQEDSPLPENYDWPYDGLDWSDAIEKQSPRRISLLSGFLAILCLCGGIVLLVASMK